MGLHTWDSKGQKTIKLTALATSYLDTLSLLKMQAYILNVSPKAGDTAHVILGKYSDPTAKTGKDTI